jgi:hypothetical protein
MVEETEIWICTIKNPIELLPSLLALSEQIRNIGTMASQLSVRIIYNGDKLTASQLSETSLAVDECIKNYPVIIDISEPLSLSAARNFALNISNADWGIYIDDDVVLNKDFVKYVYRAIDSANQNKCFLFGGRIELSGIPKNLDNLHRIFLSELDYGSPSRVLENEFINGACFGVNRKKILEMSLKFNDQLGRKGSLLLSGEDSLLVSQVRRMGASVWYENDLIVTQIVEPERLSSSWLLKRITWEAITDNIIASNLGTKGNSLNAPERNPTHNEIVRIMKLKQLFTSALNGEIGILDSEELVLKLHDMPRSLLIRSRATITRIRRSHLVRSIFFSRRIRHYFGRQR